MSPHVCPPTHTCVYIIFSIFERICAYIIHVLRVFLVRNRLAHVFFFSSRQWWRRSNSTAYLLTIATIVVVSFRWIIFRCRLRVRWARNPPNISRFNLNSRGMYKKHARTAVAAAMFDLLNFVWKLTDAKHGDVNYCCAVSFLLAGCSCRCSHSET